MRSKAVAVLAVVAGASAQSLAPSYITHIYYDDCVSSMSSMSTPVVTETDEIIITTCPTCTHTSMPSATASVSGASITPVPTLHTTVYTTSYVTLCSTGLVPNTYTVTETCSGETPKWPMATSNYLPPGFTTTVTVCTVCHSDHPTTVTLTVPCDTTPASSPAVDPTGSASVSAISASPLSSSSSSPRASATTSPVSSSSSSSRPSATASPVSASPSASSSALEDVTTTTTVCAKCSHSTMSSSVTGSAIGISSSILTPTTLTTPTTTLTPTSSGVVMATGAAAAHFPDWKASAGFLGAVAAGAIFL